MIRLGFVSYLNTATVYYPIEKGLVKLEQTEIVKDVPTELNKKLKNGELDVSVISSFEYAQAPSDYVILPRLSIGSREYVKSVLFFSKVPIKELDNKRVFITASSLTSKMLIMYIFNKMNIKPKFERFWLKNGIPDEEYWGILLIGDDALIMAKSRKFKYIYDVSKLWYDLEKKPFVFAVWCARRETYETKKQILYKLWKSLVISKEIGKNITSYIAQEKAKELKIEYKEALNYLNSLHFDLEDGYIEGMKLFYQRCKDAGFIKQIPELRFADFR